MSFRASRKPDVLVGKGFAVECLLREHTAVKTEMVLSRNPRCFEGQ